MLFEPLATNPLLDRADLQRAMRDLFEPVRPHFSPGAARVRLGTAGAHYTSASAELEAFSRPLWGLIPLAVGGGEFDGWPLYQQGLLHGTDPRHPEFWKHDANQRFVEMAAIALGLCQLPGIFWEPLSSEARQNLVTWLSTINAASFPLCNWLFFRIFVNAALRSVGAPYDAVLLEEDLVNIERQYLGGGWYSDGLNATNRDYYIPFAMHFYGLLYAALCGEADAARAQRFRERGALFAKDFIYWFSPNGAALPFGRSLTYRFAQVSFWCALSFAKVEVYPPGVIKGLVLRHLRWWFQLPIFSETGLLTVGYGYPNMLMAENYNAPGSPYWALKSFLPLAFAESDPFWTDEEEPLPELEPLSEQIHPGMILSRTGDNVVALCGGQQPTFPRHAAEKYSKFAYSTAFAFNVPTEPLNLTCRGHDSMLALSEDGLHWRVRSAVRDRRIEGGIISSGWDPWEDVRITTWLVPHGAWHFRVHHLKTQRPLHTAEGGFAICYSDEAKGNKGVDWKNGAGLAFILEAESFSGIRDLGTGRAGENILADPNANLLLPSTAIPTLQNRLEPGEYWLATAVLGGQGPGGEELWQRGNSWSSSPADTAAAFGQSSAPGAARARLAGIAGSPKGGWARAPAPSRARNPPARG